MKKISYLLVNMIVLICTVLLFYFGSFHALSGLKKENTAYFIVLVLIIVFVNALKAFRYYFILVGKNIPVKEYIKQYCKTVPVSVIVPLKLGELFRMYCYGYQLKSFFTGVVYVLVDRFFDTVALITVYFMIVLRTRVNFTWIIYLLLLFTIAIIAIYVLAPRICGYWKRHILHSPATTKSIQILLFMETIDHIYVSVHEVLKGKGGIIYFLSMIAWFIEIGGISLLQKIQGNVVDAESLLDYLSAAFGIGTSIHLQHFVLGTILLLLFTYVILHVIGQRKEHKK